MNYYRNSTQVPNELFDRHLPHLSKAQLKVLLIIIRQTIGWIDRKTKRRKSKDRISISFFCQKTGLERKSISIALDGLLQKGLVVALNFNNEELVNSSQRRGQKRIYYAYKPYCGEIQHITRVENGQNKCTKGDITKLRPKKLKKQTDRERILEILKQQVKATK